MNRPEDAFAQAERPVWEAEGRTAHSVAVVDEAGGDGEGRAACAGAVSLDVRFPPVVLEKSAPGTEGPSAAPGGVRLVPGDPTGV